MARCTIDTGIQISLCSPNSTPSKGAAATPAIVKGYPFMRSTAPIARISPFSSRCQNPSLTTAIAAFARSSSGRTGGPHAPSRPATEIIPGHNGAAHDARGRPASRMGIRRSAIRPVTVREASRKSSSRDNSGCPAPAVLRAADTHQFAGALHPRNRALQNGAKQCEQRGIGADSKTEQQDHRGGESGISAQVADRGVHREGDAAGCRSVNSGARYNTLRDPLHPLLHRRRASYGILDGETVHALPGGAFSIRSSPPA